MLFFDRLGGARACKWVIGIDLLPLRLRMGRLIAIDYGKKRCGIAVTDVLRIVPGALTTLPPGEVIPFLKEYVSKETVDRIIVGKAVQNNGLPSESMGAIRSFVARLGQAFPTIPVELYDERYTSVLAHKAILASGIGKKQRRRDKALVDRVSATILLQSYLSSLQYQQSEEQ